MLIAHCISDLLFQGPAATALGVARTQLSASASGLGRVIPGGKRRASLEAWA